MRPTRRLISQLKDQANWLQRLGQAITLSHYTFLVNYLSIAPCWLWPYKIRAERSKCSISLCPLVPPFLPGGLWRLRPICIGSPTQGLTDSREPAELFLCT